MTVARSSGIWNNIEDALVFMKHYIANAINWSPAILKPHNLRYIIDELTKTLAKCLSVPMLFAFMIKHQIRLGIYF